MVDQRDLGPDLQRRLTYQLKFALLRLEELHQDQLAPFGITARGLAVLLLLGDREPESQQQAAERLGVDRTTMVGLLDELEHKALVTRRPDPADRRRNVVALTDVGQKTLQGATRASDRAEQQLLAGLGETGARRFRELLDHVVVGDAH